MVEYENQRECEARFWAKDVSSGIYGFLSFNFRFYVRPNFIDRVYVFESSHVDGWFGIVRPRFARFIVPSCVYRPFSLFH